VGFEVFDLGAEADISAVAANVRAAPCRLEAAFKRGVLRVDLQRVAAAGKIAPLPSSLDTAAIAGRCGGAERDRVPLAFADVDQNIARENATGVRLAGRRKARGRAAEQAGLGEAPAELVELLWRVPLARLPGLELLEEVETGAAKTCVADGSER